ncbi:MULTISPECIES: hypothetical protein [unclassified Shinella]|uniref:hypothetical protein n=1 Tax=unclassified Shinella TaxID=2643062 RepID=UPI00234F7CB8|nr:MULTISPECIES: hypothetical protein [unclassified Shinella]MCO5154827.1 hypothetical protein [Shinella sp.]MDC7264309.1 hypothetical protein [Shinella sp. HY16]MDC7271205.1 hypothetical protein [Shinella sp. YZ44]
MISNGATNGTGDREVYASVRTIPMKSGSPEWLHNSFSTPSGTEAISLRLVGLWFCGAPTSLEHFR